MHTRTSSSLLGFTLIEMLIVIVIIGILAAFIIPRTTVFQERAYMSSAERDFIALSTAADLYVMDHGNYPPDADRNVPVGLEEYIDKAVLEKRPQSPWPGGIYDRDNKPANLVSYIPKEEYIQLSIRFCPMGGTLNQCKFPQRDRASGFLVDSAVYYCIKGPCRSHPSQPYTYPGYCASCK